MILNVGEHLELLGTCRCCRCGLWRATKRDVPCVPCQQRRFKKYEEKRRRNYPLTDELDPDEFAKACKRAGY